MPAYKVKVFSPIDEREINEFLASNPEIQIREIRIAAGEHLRGPRKVHPEAGGGPTVYSTCLILYDENPKPQPGAGFSYP